MQDEPEETELVLDWAIHCHPQRCAHALSDSGATHSTLKSSLCQTESKASLLHVWVRSGSDSSESLMAQIAQMRLKHHLCLHTGDSLSFPSYHVHLAFDSLVLLELQVTIGFIL